MSDFSCTPTDCIRGAVDPEGNIVAKLGTIYVRENTGTTATVYQKTSQAVAGVPDDTGWELIAAGATPSRMSASSGGYFCDDFVSSTMSAYAVLTSGANAFIAPGAGQFGIVRQQVVAVLSSAGVYPNATAANLANLSLGGPAVTFEARTMMETEPDATDRWVDVVGICDQGNTTNNPTDGVVFRQHLNLNGNKNWFAVVYSNGVLQHNVDLGADCAPAAGVWQTLRCEIAAAAAQASFYVDDTLQTTVVGNLPSGAARAMGYCLQMIKTLGNVNARNTYRDYFEIYQARS